MGKGEMELKKDLVWEGGERQWCTTAHRMWSETEKIGCKMRQLKISKKRHAKHVSFSNSTRIDRIRALQLNKHTHIRLRYKSLNDVKTLDKAVFNNKTHAVAEGLM